MKKNSILIVVLLFVTMLALVAISSTYAKYTSAAVGTDTAVVAKWKITEDLATKSVDLFSESKIYDLKGVTDFTAEGTDDLDVRNRADGIIAPGTWGKFSFNIKNDSDVTAEYALAFTVNEAGVPLQWSTDGKTWTDDLANVAATKLAMDANTDVTVYWKWEFEGDDTALGTAGTAKPSVTIDATFTQVD